MINYNYAQEAAKILFESRLNRLSLNNLPHNLIPLSYDDAYLIQNELKIEYNILNIDENLFIKAFGY